jgi:acetyl-CoA carboxylase biotin carboxylase subunit
MGECAVAIVKAAKYHSVGTVEFLLDEQGHFYFMEVNTRIQVEHTVTEELTGIDLVQWQIRIAQGEKLTLRQKDIEYHGHVFEFRINAENPAHQFAPSPGLLEHYTPPGGPHVRVDSACYGGYRIPPNYDSMIAKLIVRGKNREEAISHAKRALREFHIAGVYTTIPFHQYMLEDKRFLTHDYTINYIDNLLAEGCNFTC